MLRRLKAVDKGYAFCKGETYGLGRAEMRLLGLCLLVMAVCGVLMAGTCPADVLMDRDPDEILNEADFYIEPRPNYQGSYWIIDQKTRKIIGYAPWDAVKRRWTLFNLRSQYRGFLQATMGDPDPPHLVQYLYYGKDGNYRGVFIADIGGRPVTPQRPHGELGGGLSLYPIGNIPIALPEYEPEVQPLRLFPEGVDISPVDPLPVK